MSRRYHSNSATLRDLQRALAATLRSGNMTNEMYWHAKDIADRCNLHNDVEILLPVVSRLVAKHGPATCLKDMQKMLGEERKKGTDEVHPATTQASNDAHGGDGRSGEVPDGLSQSGDASSDSRQVAAKELQNHEQSDTKEETGDQGNMSGQGTADRHTANRSGVNTEESKVDAQEPGDTTSEVKMDTQEVQGPSSVKDSTAQMQQKCSGESAGDKKCDERTATSDALRSEAVADSDVASADQTSADNGTDKAADRQGSKPKQTGEDQGDTSEKTPFSKTLKRLDKASTTSRKAHNKHGGITAELKKAQIPASLVGAVRSVLASWTVDGGHDEQSPRWDYPPLAARLLTRRSPYPARKEELGRPVLLVLADVSGSCASFSEQSLLVAKAIALQGVPGCDVLVVSHSNGYPEACEINGKPLPAGQYQRYKRIADGRGASYRSDGVEGNVAFYTAMIADYTVTHVIALGDHDAVDVYTMLAENSEVVWLDNYACNYHAPRIEKPEVQKAAILAKIRYVTGCKGAPAFLLGLRVAIGG